MTFATAGILTLIYNLCCEFLIYVVKISNLQIKSLGNSIEIDTGKNIDTGKKHELKGNWYSSATTQTKFI